mmetsp:Transcript_18342/g.22012  ORF Transcript_18342/g.22012 Transcript_18342/m.22012 type:complete len:325 (-) Transcript_18342:154-1128(-)|eukprot:CAMPEP_0197865922 /NCGR_PEP_ID=MMETSP1438-20131217/43933_1 /TAXON_ID=1461541 /ORGANISM="Pterosperma sp., Strain CCMP1384" /LENGTH=324 /DNA_ID=CAMNT_0043484445 /DNA_START=834 /DNA_END=1808 /DNA_ORIENTATION=-
MSFSSSRYCCLEQTAAQFCVIERETYRVSPPPVAKRRRTVRLSIVKPRALDSNHACHPSEEHKPCPRLSGQLSRRSTSVAIPVALTALFPGVRPDTSYAQEASAAIDDTPERDNTLADPDAQYDAYANAYDNLNGGPAAEALGFDKLRAELISRATGNILEVGVGTGLNLPLYRSEQVKGLTGIDLSQGMLNEAAVRGSRLPIQGSLSLVRADVEQLPFDSDSFDSVVDTFSLCVFPKPLEALQELARVVQPGGKVLLLEHNRSPNAIFGAYQDLTAKPVAAMSKGCAYNQDVPLLMSQAGLKIVEQTPALGGLILLIEAVKTH